MKRLSLLLLFCLLPPRVASSEHAAADIDSVVTLLEFVIDVDQDTARKCLATLRKAVENGEVDGPRLAVIRKQLGKKLSELISKGPDAALSFDAALVATAWGDAQATRHIRSLAFDRQSAESRRVAAIDSLAAARDEGLLNGAAAILTQKTTSSLIAARLLAALGKYDSARVSDLVLQSYDALPPDMQPRAVELLTQRAAWSRRLLTAIGDGKLSPSVLNVNQVRKLLASPDKQLVSLVRDKWGEVRSERNPAREQVIREMKMQLSQETGDPLRGQQVFNRICGQCHKIYGAGQDVGPEITRNGRGTFDQLLDNIFDPSLVIGASYQARTVITTDGRVLTGLLAENNAQRVVLKTQGGKLETIPRDQVDEIAISKLSLMPEGLEKQLPPRDLADLFAFLVLDRPPGNPAASLISGTPETLVGP